MMMSTQDSAATELPKMIELPWMKSTTYKCDDKVIMEIILCILE